MSNLSFSPMADRRACDQEGDIALVSESARVRVLTLRDDRRRSSLVQHDAVEAEHRAARPGGGGGCVRRRQQGARELAGDLAVESLAVLVFVFLFGLGVLVRLVFLRILIGVGVSVAGSRSPTLLTLPLGIRLVKQVGQSRGVEELVRVSHVAADEVEVVRIRAKRGRVHGGKGGLPVSGGVDRRRRVMRVLGVEERVLLLLAGALRLGQQRRLRRVQAEGAFETRGGGGGEGGCGGSERMRCIRCAR